MTLTTESAETQNPHRLPRTVVPNRYDIELAPDLEQFTFTGHETIAVEIGEPVDEIVLNCIEIDISSATVEADGRMHRASISHDEPMQRAILAFDTELPAGPAKLEIEFTGTLNDQLHGFYRSTFTDVDGNEQVIATTQFEATDARRAFPCWDEPDFKAVFAITLVVPDHLFAVSNMAEISREDVGDGKVRIRYGDSMVMSTYLVAFVVGPFESTETVDVDGVPLRIIAPKGKIHLTDFALECGAFCLRYLRDYYGIEYPGDKVDMIAIPDFAFGAMENLGAITYRETALLVDTSQASQAELVRILDVIAHELAHMWFGDLVTMKWWDGIWLNEAFATFMEMKATDAMRPEWKRWLAFGATERPWAYGTDSLASTRPVEFEVMSPDEANEMFDALTYGKGSSVLRMIEQFLGEQVFRQGVGSYLRRHSYSNTVTSDLWHGLDSASGTDVGAIMDTWILQRGFPQVEVSRTSTGIRLEQRRYLTIPDETDTTRWKIPVVLRGKANGSEFVRKLLLDSFTTEIPIEGEIEFVVANAGGHGFYRVDYVGEFFQAAVDNLEELNALERFCLIDDAWAFVESGQKSAAEWLALASSYRNEQEQAIWNAVLTGMAGIRHHIVSDDDLPAFRRAAKSLLEPSIDRLGWTPDEDDSDLTRRLRGAIIGAMGRLAEDEETIEQSRQIADRWIADAGSVDPDLGQASLFTMAAHGDMGTMDRIMEAYDAASTPQAKLKLLQAVTFLDANDTVDATLGAVRSGRIKSQDGSWVVARLFGGRASGRHAWQEVRRDWDDLTALMPPMTLRRLVEGLPGLSHPDIAQDVEAFFAERSLPVIETTAKQNIERLRANVLMRTRETDRLSARLSRPAD
jgi:puromycin-sensitive aminopeptidase